MAKEIRESAIEALLEEHLNQLKKINEGIHSILAVQIDMKKELESMRPMKEEWPVLKMAVKDIGKDVTQIKKDVNEMKIDVKEAKSQINDLDKKVALVLPNHERRITKLEHKPA